MGYPLETLQVFDESKTRMCYNPFLLALPLLEPKLSFENFDAAFNFLLDAKRDELWWPNGTPAELPNKLDGISGCPIWQVAWPDGRWQPDHARIVGVQIGYYRTRSAIKSTYWGAVAKILSDDYPVLRDILEMHLGRA